MSPIKILAFGISRDIIGGAEVEIHLPDAPTVGQLRQRLYQQYPDLQRLRSLAIAVAEEYAQEDRLIQPGEEVVLIPPVSGG